MIIEPDPSFNEWIGFVIVVALPDEQGADGLVSYALGLFDDAESAQLAAMVAQRDAPEAFVRWSPLRRPAPVECPVRAVIG